MDVRYVAILFTALLFPALPGNSAPPAYIPASFQSIPTKAPLLMLFPSSGPPKHLPLPKNLPYDFRLIQFSPDGTALYGQTLDSWEGITKIEFAPLRRSVVPGSEGFSKVSSLVMLKASGTMLFSGAIRGQGRIECGIFELSPGSREAHTLFERWEMGFGDWRGAGCAERGAHRCGG